MLISVVQPLNYMSNIGMFGWPFIVASCEVVARMQISCNEFDFFKGTCFREDRSVQEVVLAVICPLCLFM